MAVLRCPYCGEKVDKGDRFCRHCGQSFDKPVVDEISTSFQESGRLIVKLVGFFVLWFIVLLLVGLVWNGLDLPMNYGIAFVLSFVLTLLVVLLIKLKT